VLNKVEGFMDKKQEVAQKTTGKDGSRHYTTTNKSQSSQPQTNRPAQPQGNRTAHSSNSNRDSQYKHNYSNTNQQSRFRMDKVKPVETAEDIRNDIDRIEKEIELEIKEIKSMRLGI
jgi:hypothetical protein